MLMNGKILFSTRIAIDKWMIHFSLKTFSHNM